MQENILLIQGDATDAQAVLNALAGPRDRPFNVEWVTTCALGLQCLAYLGRQHAGRPGGIGAILLDLRLPDVRGIDAFEQLFAASPTTPILVLNAPPDEDVAKLAVARGAFDYLPKGRVDDFLLPRILAGMIDRAAQVEALCGEKDLAQSMLESLGDAVISTDLNGGVTYLNPIAEQLTGWDRADALGLPFDDVFKLIHADTRERVSHWTLLANTDGTLDELPSSSLLVRRGGADVAIEDSCAPLYDRHREVAGAIMVFHDVSAARETAARLAYLAQHDSLTDLPNRNLLNDRLAQAITMAKRHQTTLAVLFLDLDRFKHINDSLGHLVGDRLLQSVATRLSRCVRESDTVGRQGGDEFVILLPDLKNSHDAALCAEKLIQSVKEPYVIDEHKICITASIGIVLFPDDSIDVEGLLERADSAMYQAKSHGRSGYQFHRADVNSRAVERQLVEDGLRHAVERHEFELHYQPIVNLATGKASGVEALIRWRRPSLGFVPPAQFIPEAEDCGLMVPIGRWVLDEACRQAQEWVEAGLSPLRLAVNISAAELRSRDFVAGVAATLERTRFDPCCLDFELTETFLMQDSKATASTLSDLKQLGVHFALDDFGTGYSSLSYARRYPIDALKVDRSFVRDLSTDADDACVVRAVVNMGRSLHMRVVAEGVETADQARFLREQACDEAQGFYFCRPQPAAHIADFLRRQESDVAADRRSAARR